MCLFRIKDNGDDIILSAPRPHSAPGLEDSKRLSHSGNGSSFRAFESSVPNRGARQYQTGQDEVNSKVSIRARSPHLAATEQILQGRSLSNPLQSHHNSASRVKVTIVSQAKPIGSRDLEEESLPRFMTGDLTPETATELPGFLHTQLDTSAGVIVM